AFAAKLSSAGSPVWARGYGDPGGATDQRATGVAIDSSGALFIAAEFDGQLDFGGKMPLSATKHAGALAKIAGDSMYVWEHAFDGADGLAIAALTTDTSGSVILAGGFSGVIDFDGDKGAAAPLASTGAEDAFLVKFDAAGNLRWSTALGGTVAGA